MSAITVNTLQGQVIGRSSDGISTFRGIPFARYERFRRARMSGPWTEPLDATRYGVMCPQRSSRLAALLSDGGPLRIEEGTLCCSVYAPEGAQNLPVMVWIHGGAYLTGGSEDPRYGAERLVRTGNVIVVKISYRLGALGYLYLPQMGVCNLGLYDQKLGLEWVRDNISAFGGNPDDVTVFGQSAGAQSIAALISIGASNLFSKAVMQSAPFGIAESRKEASRIAGAYICELRKLVGRPLCSVDDEELLRSAPLNLMLDAQDKVMSMKLKTGMTFMPVLDEYTAVPGGKLKLVAGYALQDASPFLAGTLGRLLPTPFGRAAVAYATRRIFSRPAEKYAKKCRKAGVQAQIYRFKWFPKGNPMGACHCIELPFLLGEYEDWAEAQMLRGMTREEFDACSAAVLGAWTAFARTGEFPASEF